MKFNNLKGSAILCTAALVWGLAFTAQSQAADLVPSFMINALRSFIAAAALYVLFLVFGRKKNETFFPREKADLKKFLIGGLLCGLLLSFSANFQMFGIAAYPNGVASEARAGFLTSLYVILVPIVSIFIGKKANLLVWLSVLVALLGVYMLCFSGSFEEIYLGDILMLVCALGFTFHIIFIDKYVGFVGGIKLSVMQFLVTAVVSLVLSFIFEWKALDIDNILSAALPIVYLGIMSSGVGYTLQIIGQKYAEPAVASISMSLESVFAALGGWVILGNKLSPKEIFGCLLVFAAIILAQLPEFSKTQKTQN
ncbi:MAG: DMT family transporter [Ruminococcaceae bacterium]|nr:DMT family transporter [Oscillospiraceae bacterium]